MKNSLYILLIFSMFKFSEVSAQLSPGPLASPHSHLEGMSNCTRCHTLGSKISNDKCLDCHTELKKRIDARQGYHSSSEISGKECINCHSDHHGPDFQLIRLDIEKFNHNLTGYPLEGAHNARKCPDCHRTAFITDPVIKEKKFTYLGLNTECLSCHDDYHQKTLPEACTSCHTMESFKPAVKFNHSSARFQLKGSHKDVSCSKCHKVISRNGKPFQEFKGIAFDLCTRCHSDPHRNQFGPECTDCHTVESFASISGTNRFNHSKTHYVLENKHLEVSCRSCHKSGYSQPLKFGECTDCHSDYHKGQFMSDRIITDCSSCHSTTGFDQSSFTIDRHNEMDFQLGGAHLAVPCTSCHKTQGSWIFRNIGLKCVDCHEDIHRNYINEKYYPASNCLNCHSAESWNNIQAFNHSSTSFPLTGTHATQSCRECHFKKDSMGNITQSFRDLPKNCSNCHNDIHFGQFELNDSTHCSRCHSTSGWNIDHFDHNSTDFVLDGKHKDLRCDQCHKYVTDGRNQYILYKIKDTRCESCHL